MAQVEVNNQNTRRPPRRACARRARWRTQARARCFPCGRQRRPARARGARQPTPATTATTAARRAATATTSRSTSSWELDLWGAHPAHHRGREATRAGERRRPRKRRRFRRRRSSRRTTSCCACRTRRSRCCSDTVAAYERSLQLTRNQYAVGVAARGDVVQAEAQLKSTQAQAIDAGMSARAARARDRGADRQAAGGAHHRAATPMHAVFPDIPLGAAVRRCSSAGPTSPPRSAAPQPPTRRSASREAAFFPSIIAVAPPAAFRARSSAACCRCRAATGRSAPALAQTIFDAGLRRAQTAQAVATYDETVATYRQTVLTGFQEVEDNLAALRILGRKPRCRRRRSRPRANPRRSPSTSTSRHRELSRRGRAAGDRAQQRAHRARHHRAPPDRERRAHQGAGRRMGRHATRRRAAVECADGQSAAFDLTGRVALVTGAYRGLGFAIARGMRKPAPPSSSTAASPTSSKAAKTLTDAGHGADMAAFDVTERDAVDRRGRGAHRAARPRRHPRQQRRHPAARAVRRVLRRRTGTTSSRPTSPRRSSCRRRCCPA